MKLIVEGLSKSYLYRNKNGYEKVRILEDINLVVREKELVSIFGPNGCGKTTLLKIIANLIDKEKGIIKIDGKDYKQAHVGYIFQNYADSLLPWRLNIDNIALPLELQRISRSKRYNRVKELLSYLNLEIELSKYPYQLSEGQKQLVALARALIYQPEILLMDEPFSSLDHNSNFYMLNKLLDIWQKTSQTIIFVSHRIDECIYLSDRIVVLKGKPSRISHILENPLPRPRSPDAMHLQDFLDIKKQILSLSK